MFEKRLRLFLFIVFLGGFLLALRAAQVQVLDRDEWIAQATSSAEQISYIPAKRGDLLDFKGRVIATDQPSFEASVNFRAIPRDPDAAWLRAEARRRAMKLPAWTGADDDTRLLLVAQEETGIRHALDAMWDELARLSGQSRAQIDAIRDGIVDEVQARHTSFWKRKYNAALREYEEDGEAPWYVRWISGERKEPEEATFIKERIDEQNGYHTILPDLAPEQYNELALAQERWPLVAGLGNVVRLRPAVHRVYPFEDVGCHVIGRVGRVTAEDRANDPNKGDELRSYSLNDRVGREGLEWLAEQVLRGNRGTKSNDRRGGALWMEVGTAGENVRTTLDMELQAAIQNAFREVTFRGPDKDADGHPIDEKLSMNGAAVIIDVPTGQVRALVSVPTYDLNKFNVLYETFEGDLNRPLMNRALLDAIEPGSTVKPIVGIGAVTQGLIGAHDPIECTGYPVIDGKRQDRPRCWTMSLFGRRGLGAHHVVPTVKPHPTGHLTLADAIERSCNVYFVTEGDKLAIEGLSYWMQRFGYGRRTGIGLPESRGLVPSQARIPREERLGRTWIASIGQGPVHATPIQVANQFATLAREGVWMRPTLFVEKLPTTQPTTPDPDALPDRIDLKLDPAALRAVHEGMVNVVNSDAGTGTHIRRADVTVAGKTGSATAAQLSRLRRDASGKPIRDDNGRAQFELVPYGSMNRPNPELPWYRLSGYNDSNVAVGTHSWVAGYAPAENPQIAFAVYVEYGGSGGVGASSVAVKMLEACVEQGYLRTRTPAPRPVPPPMLMRPIEEPEGPVD